MMLNALMGDVAFYIERHIVKRLKDINFGEDAPKVKLKIKPLSRTNEQTAAMIFNALLQNAEVGGIDVTGLLKDIAGLLGVNIADGEEVIGKKLQPITQPSEQIKEDKKGVK